MTEIREDLLSKGHSRLVRPLVMMSLAFHDLGKLTEGFQEVLVQGVRGVRGKAQPVRHELISFLLLHLMYEDYCAGQGSRDELDFWAHLAADPENVTKALETAWRGLPNLLQSAVGTLFPDDKSLVSKQKVQATANFWLDEAFGPSRSPLLQSVGFCVLSHHRIPAGRNTHGHSRRWSALNHVHRHDAASLATFSRPCGGWRKAVSGGWSQAVARLAGTLVLRKRAIGVPSPEVMASLSAHVVRSLVILGDHLASSAGKASGIEVVGKRPHGKADWVPHAKTMKSSSESLSGDGDGEEAVMGDTWAIHTSRGMLHAETAIRTLAVLERRMPALRMDDIGGAVAVGRFAWQDTACEVVAEKAGDGPALMFLLAGTGTGKTRASFRMLTSGRSSCRVTSLLGLRSLTLQTGEEYARRGGLPESKVASVIGSQLEMALREAYGREREKLERFDPSSPDGSDADMSTGMERDLLPGADFGDPLPPLLEDFCRGKPALRKFLATPVVACTVDMLAPVSDALRGSHLAALIRLSSSDVIVDEMDSYDIEDAQAICRLAYHVALAGRRMVAASATMPPSLMCALHEAYAAGHRLRSDVTGELRKFAVVLASENDCTGWSAENETSQDFRGRVTSFVWSQSEVLKTRVQLRRVGILRIGDDWKTDVEGAVTALHRDNRLVDPVTGRGFSAGFVRMNVTRDARALARRFMEHGIPGISCRILCYHARFAVGVRSEVDAQLNSMLSRKHEQGEADPIFSNPHVRRALDDGKTDDVVVVVVSTPLIELGRDFDLDWAILEPSGVSSVIQSGGRVLRHRPWLQTGSVNVLVMDRALNPDTLKRQGLFRSVRTFSGVDGFRPMPLREDVESLFPFWEWSHALDARDALLPFSPGSRLVEARREIAFTGQVPQEFVSGMKPSSLNKRDVSEAEELSLRAWLENPGAALTDVQANFRRFRRKTEHDLVFSLHAEKGWEIHQTKVSAPSKDKQVQGNFNGKVVCMPLSGAAGNRCLFPLRTFDVLGQAADKAELLGEVDEDTKRELTYVTLGLKDVSDLATLRAEFVAELGIDRVRRAV